MAAGRNGQRIAWLARRIQMRLNWDLSLPFAISMLSISDFGFDFFGSGLEGKNECLRVANNGCASGGKREARATVAAGHKAGFGCSGWRRVT